MPTAPRQQAPIARGETIEVQPGDTLYGLSRRHHVSVDELTKLNDLSGPMIRPGQKLVLPSSASHGGKPASSVAAVAPARPAPPISATPQPAAVASVPPAVAGLQIEAANSDGAYTIKPGDSLYGIARVNKMTVAELKRLNSITDERKLRPGTVLRIRETASPSPAVATAPSTPASIAAPAMPASLPPAVTAEAKVDPVAPVAGAPNRPTIINAAPAGKMASLGRPETASDAAAEATTPPPVATPKKGGAEVASAATQSASAVPAAKFRWPVKGRVISPFGPRPDGTSNDGVDISVPLGTDVVAAEAGVVAYAGSELKGFGNLVLVRHDNGWVTAYAHNEELLVKRGDKVRRGQTIAKAGKSGQADQPMVHFEIRQGSKPVDPTPLMEKI